MSKLIDLSLNTCVGLIVKSETGFLYSNQAGGVCCNHPAQEGVYFPLEGLHHDQEHLMVTFCGEADYWNLGDSPEEVKELNKKFESLDLPIMVDEECLDLSEEAWINVKITNAASEDRYQYTPFHDLAGMKAVLVYPNSD